MATLSLSLLGSLQVTLDGEPTNGFKSDKVRALLVFLAVEADRALRRSVLAALLWPDIPDRSARNNLRDALANLRTAIGDRDASPPFLLISRDTVQFNAASDHWLDVSEFLRLVEVEEEERTVALEQAASLYHGPFLEGFSIKASPAFDDWSLLTREQLQRQAVLVQRSLAQICELAGDYDRAAEHARRQLELEPWEEDAHRQLMRLLALSGQRGSALSHYETCKRTLAEELGVEPSAQTDTLYQQIRDGDLEALTPNTSQERPPRQVGDCPYRGLAAFREADAPFFYGRETFTGQLLDAVQRHKPAAVVVGSSGCGKSSAVSAGLLPELRESGDWLIAHCRPSASPFHALAAALLPHLDPDLDATAHLIQTRELAGALLVGETSLAEVVQRALAREPDAARFLLFIDQFEETYTLCSEPALRRRFLDALLAAVDAGAGQRPPTLCLLLTLRADFMGQALAYRPFADLLQTATLMMGPMNRSELTSAILEPARLQGAEFEPGLVDRLMEDVGDQPGRLPLLEFSLTLLWQDQSDGWLTHDGYDRTGGALGALASYADGVLAELSAEDQHRAQQAFVQLVRPGLGTEDTRRLATRDELGDESWALVQHLASKRLVTTGQNSAGRESAEVAHEALIQRWGQLREWMDVDRAFRTWQEGLRAALRAWRASDKDQGGLLRGVPLAQAESWLDERGSELSAVEQAYIRAGIAHRQRRRHEQDRRRRWTLLALAGGLVMAIALAAVALVAWNQAQMEASTSQSRVLASDAQRLNNGGEAGLALALALQSVKSDDPPPESKSTLATLAQSPGTRAIIQAHDNAVTALAFAQNPHLAGGGWLALTASCGRLDDDQACRLGEIALWDLDAQIQLKRFRAHGDRITSLAVSPDGRTALSASADGSLGLWDLDLGTQVRRLTGHTGGIRDVAIGPEGLSAVSASDDTSLIHWDLASGQQIQVLEGHTGPVTSVAYSPDGTTALSGSDDTDLIWWDLATGQAIERLTGHDQGRIEAEFVPGGELALSTAADHSIRIWDLASGTELKNVDYVMGESRLAVHPNGRSFLISADPLLQIWDLAALRQSAQLRGHSAVISAVEFSPDGSLALTGAKDGSVRLWDMEGQGKVHRFASQGPPIMAVDTSPDGQRLLTGGAQVLVWDLNTRQVAQRLEGFIGPVGPGAVTFSPNGALALAVSEDLYGLSGAWSVILWDAQTGEMLHDFQENLTYARSAAISPDGELALTGSQELEGDAAGDLLLWRLSSGEIVRRFDTSDDITDIAFSSDGKRALTGSAWFPSPVLWDVATGQPIIGLAGHPNHLVLAVAFGPDETTAVSASAEGGIILWDLTSGEIIRRYKGHEAGILGLDVSPDGQRLISGDTEGTVILWDLMTGEEIRRYRGHSAPVFDVAFAADGQTAFSVSPDGQIIQWQTGALTLDELVAWLATNRHIPTLTCEQRDQYRIKPYCDE